MTAIVAEFKGLLATNGSCGQRTKCSQSLNEEDAGKKALTDRDTTLQKVLLKKITVPDTDQSKSYLQVGSNKMLSGSD